MVQPILVDPDPIQEVSDYMYRQEHEGSGVITYGCFSVVFVIGVLVGSLFF